MLNEKFLIFFFWTQLVTINCDNGKLPNFSFRLDFEPKFWPKPKDAMIPKPKPKCIPKPKFRPKPIPQPKVFDH
jgi:hypothetical protein